MIQKQSLVFIGVAIIGVVLAAETWRQQQEGSAPPTEISQPGAFDARSGASATDPLRVKKPGDAIGDLAVRPVRDTQKSYAPPPLPASLVDGVAMLPPNNANTDLALGNVGGFNFDEPLLRVNPLDPDNIVITSHGGLTYSTDGGATWSAFVNYPNTLGANNGDTGMTFDSQGRLFWATLFSPGGGARPLQIMEVNPLTGATIQNPIDIITATGDPATSSDDKEYIVADEYPGSPYTDNIYMVFTRLVGNWTAFTTFSTDQGATWSPLLAISTGADNQPWPSDIAVAPNGDVYATFHAGLWTGTTGYTQVVRSTDGGVSFPQVTTPFAAGESDVTDNVVDGSGSGAPIPGLQFWMLGSGQPWILADPARPGNVYVVTNDDPDDTHGSGDDADVVFARSTDNGLTWTTSTIPDGSGGAHQVYPFAAIDQLGNIAVAWLDTRSGATNGFGRNLLDVFATYSTDGGLTWAPAFQVNDANNPIDPDFPNNQRRIPTPQITPCAKTPATNTETCRIGEYFGIDIDNGVAHLTWLGNTYDGGGNVAGDQLWYDSFGLPTDVSITKTDGLAEVAAGAQLTYTITVLNDGDVNADNVSVVDTLPAGLEFVSSTEPSCAEDPANTITCALGFMTPGQQIQFDIVANVSAALASGTVLTNSATVDSGNFDTNAANNTAEDGTGVIRQVDVVVTKVDNIDPVVAGSGVPNLRYNIEVENLGPSDVTDLTLLEALTLPANVTLHEVEALSGSYNEATNEWNVSIPAGGSGLLVVFVNVPLQAEETDIISNTISVTGSGGGEEIINTGDDSATEETAIRWPTAYWEVFKEYATGGAGPVEVHLECTDDVGLAFGNPAEGTTTANLQWRRFDINTAQCSVVEEVPGGYYELERTEDCDVDPVADVDDGGSYSCTITNAVTRATVRMTKEFSDGDHQTPVTVLLDCSSGLILDQSKVITEGVGNYVEFVVTSFTDGTLDCLASEDTDLLDGYTPSYQGGVTVQQADDDVAVQMDASGCQFTGITGGAELYCDVTNDVDPQPVVITKEWVFEGSASPSDLDMGYRLTLHCDAAVIVDGDEFCGLKKLLDSPQGDNGLYWCKEFSDDEAAVFEASVIPFYPSSECWVVESLNSDFVEVDNGCTSLQISAGQGDECTVINTVFFEGIPFLGRQAQLLLLLLVLGVGVWTIRRLT
jgi:uncharacterized repeat protein (TIGR01451 family)